MKKILSRVEKLSKPVGKSKVTKLHILIAAVAIIECLILISFTTYSWIETASSLVIETGKRNYDESYSTRIPIANALNYKFVVRDGDSISDLNDYFSYAGQSSTQNLYRYARASSANGKNFYFKNSGVNGSGSTVTGQAAYRAGDYVDINSNYTYFDFTVANTDNQSSHKLKFYFADANVFSVTNSEGSTLTDTQLNTIRDAMRISFQTGSGTPRIYSQSGVDPYNAVNSTSGETASVTTTEIQASENQKLFTVGKGGSQNISVRIWLEEKASGISGLTGTQLAGAKISVNLKLAYAQNDYDYLYFDDYTFSSGINNKENIGGHLTGDHPESDNYRMYFVYQTSATGTNRHVYPMTIDDSGSNVDARCWVTCDNTGTASSTIPDISGQTYVTNLTTSGNAALNYSYFAYGAWSKSDVGGSSAPSTPLYRWDINNYCGTAKNASSEAELRYCGFSATKYSSSDSYGNGAGGWSYNTPLSMVYFRDLATGMTENSYNAGGYGTNFKYITHAVNTASDDPESNENRSNVMYVNILNDTSYNTTNAAKTATMYYDKGADGGNGLFVSWVPTAWLSDANLNFRYSPSGFYNEYSAVKWLAGAASKPSNATDYIYTGLGYSNDYTLAYCSANAAGTYGDGVGCWNPIEAQPVYFSTELLDNEVTSAFRYQIGVNINNGSAKYYNLIPDETNTKFYAYIPVPGTVTTPTADYADGAILFQSYDKYSDGSQTGAINGTWWGKVRNGSRVYYPIALNTTTTATSAAPKGYWNLSVIVDGTYEHFFWDYGDDTTTSDDKVLGSFSYNTTGHTGSPTYTTITPNMIDEYRWYVPFDVTTIGTAMPEAVYFKWVPYAGKDDTEGTSDDTVFLYSHYRSDGIYCVITEAPDNTPANAFS